MSQTIFAPQSTQANPPVKDEKPTVTPKSDATSRLLITIARWSVVGFAGLLPLFFVPGLWGSLGFQKSILAMGVVGVVVILISLLALRSKIVVTVVPMSLLLFFGVVFSAVAAAIFSPDWLGAFRGNVVETQTVAFLALLAGVMSIGLVMQHARQATFQLFSALMVGGLAVLLYTVVRLFAGPVLSFNSFTNLTLSPVGNFNDLAVFSGLTILISMIALLQLRLAIVMRSVLVLAVALALVVLAAVNFFYVWLVVGFFGLLVLLYLVSQDTLFASDQSSSDRKQPLSHLAIGIAAVICITSGAFIVAGDYLGGLVSDTFVVEYMEVRPSLSATVDIMQATYQEDLLFGAGPNQFISSWRSFKNSSINQTIFWSTDFRAGSGYFPTLFVNLGLVGALFIVAFHLWYAWNGVRMLLRPVSKDSFWYFTGLVSFTGALFLWGISYVYIPGPTLLLLAALLTGISLAAAGSLQPQKSFTVPLAINQQRGFILMAFAILLISSVMGTWFTFGKQYVAQSSFAQAQAASLDQAALDQAALDQAALASFLLYPDDNFLSIRARLALFEMNQILSITEPSEADQQRFLEASDRALTFAAAAASQAATEPSHHAVLAGIYNNLAIAGVQNAAARATSSIAVAQALDPKNPTYALLTAQLAANRGDSAASREALMNALQSKNNFSEALYLLAQLDIAEGNVEAAITTTQAIIRLEPNNPTRYYQLGILESSTGGTAAAKQAYSAAVQLDPNFANARYLLALLQIADGEFDPALTSLRIILESNDDNAQLQELVAALEAGNVPALDADIPGSVNETVPTVGVDAVTSSVVPESNLLTPLNTVGDSTSEPASALPTEESEPKVDSAEQELIEEESTE